LSHETVARLRLLVFTQLSLSINFHLSKPQRIQEKENQKKKSQQTMRSRATTAIIAASLYLSCFTLMNAQPVEEFLIRGPDQLHTIAINTFLEERRKNPEVKDMGETSPVMIRAKQHAIKRFSVLDDSELTLLVR
jgi:hypothetical protein